MNPCFQVTPFRILRRVLGGLLIATVVATLFGFIVEQLWNALMPNLFHLPILTWLQSIGLVLLSRLLVGHVGPHHGNGPPWRRMPFLGKERHQFRDWFEREGRDSFQAWKGQESA